MLKNIKLGFLCAILFLLPCELLSQSVYGPINPNYYREIVKTGSGSYSSGLIPSNSYCIIGKNMYQGQQLESRIVLQWDIPNNIIPDNSTISNVTLYFTYSKYQHNFEMGAQFSSLSINNANPSQAQLEQMWTQMSTTTIGTKTGVNNVLEFSSNNPDDNFNIAIRDALVNDRFVLGIIVPLSPSITDRIWNIQNPSVTISI